MCTEGLKEFDIGSGLGNYEYDFFAINGKKDFQLLFEHYGRTFNRFDYFYDGYYLSENNVELSPTVQQKMMKYSANISLTLSKEHLISVDARTRVLCINERTSAVTYDTYFYDLYYFSTKGIKDYVECGRHYAAYRFHQAASRCFSHGIMLAQNKPLAFTLRGSSFMAMGNHDEAIADFTQAINLDPEKHRPFLRRGIAYRKIGDLEKAKADLEKTLELRPKTITAKKILEEMSKNE